MAYRNQAYYMGETQNIYRLCLSAGILIILKVYKAKKSRKVWYLTLQEANLLRQEDRFSDQPFGLSDYPWKENETTTPKVILYVAMIAVLLSKI